MGLEVGTAAPPRGLRSCHDIMTTGADGKEWTGEGGGRREQAGAMEVTDRGLRCG